MRISDWSSDVCSSDLAVARDAVQRTGRGRGTGAAGDRRDRRLRCRTHPGARRALFAVRDPARATRPADDAMVRTRRRRLGRSEEHTSELQSLMRISYAVFCLKKKIHQTTRYTLAT